MASGLPAFATVATPVPEDFELLGTATILPYEDGAGAVELWVTPIAGTPVRPGRDRDVFERLSVRLRGLLRPRMTSFGTGRCFHALNRRIWELREEMDLLSRFCRHRRSHARHRSLNRFHRPQTYRGAWWQAERLQGSCGRIRTFVLPPPRGRAGITQRLQNSP